MKKKVLKIMIFLLLIISLQTSNICKAQSQNYINNIIHGVNGKVCEGGVRIDFKTNLKPLECCNVIYNNFDFIERPITNYKEVLNGYEIDFKQENLNGYIICSKNSNKENNVSIVISYKGNEDKTDKLMNEISNASKYEGYDFVNYKYIRAQIDYSNSDEINNKIISRLISIKAKNVKTIHLDNGLSTVAFTGKYQAKKDGNGIIDLNYAICKYKSGDYIIIGTPIIPITY